MARIGIHLARGAAAAGAVVLAVVAGAGWLYLLRDLAALAEGPRVSGALPLQRLAGGDAQPLVRVLAAWIPAALVCRMLLGTVTRLRAPGRAAAAGLGSLVLLLAYGAVADTVTASDTLGPHVAPQLGHGATWLAAALMGAAALIPPLPRPRSGLPEAAAAATRSGGSAGAAA
jgi:hypothetical protein